MVDQVLAKDEPGRAFPVVFGPAERPITGLFHPGWRRGGSSAAGRSLGVILCDPLGYEAMSAHRTYRVLAERLASRGYPALRFDYDGTGNSPGRFDAPDRVNAWLASVQAALSYMRSRPGVERVALFGVRFGGTLATLAAEEDGQVECLIAWAPVVSGRAHERELRAFRLLKERNGAAAGRADGGEEVAGYLFSKETLASIGAIDLLAGTGPLCPRVLILPGDRRATGDAKLATQLEGRGANVRILASAGYARMMRDDPYETVVPVPTLDAIVDWLDEGRYEQRAAPTTSVDAPRSLVVRAPGSGVAVTETALRFGDRSLFGVVTAPEGATPPDSGGAPSPEGRPAVCFLNVGANHEVGPHRLNVELAREMAALGYTTLRFDASGLGDSPAGPSGAENRIYTKEAIADVQSAMDLLASRCGSRRFVLVGLCSGAYLAYHTAIVDPRVAGQVLLSPYAFEWKEGDPVTLTEREDFRTFKSSRFYARAVLEPGVWRRILRGEVNVRAVGGVLVERAISQIEAALPSVTARVQRRRRPATVVEGEFRRLCERGVVSLLALSIEDGGLDMIARYLGNDARRMRGYDNFALQVIDDADHTFTTLASRDNLRLLLVRYLAAHFP